MQSKEPLDTRRTRMRAAASQVARLQSQKAAVAGGNTLRRPLVIRRVGGATPAPTDAAAASGPPGQMIRAPGTLKITRTPVDGPATGGPAGAEGQGDRGPRAPGARGPGGPNLRGRAPRREGGTGAPGRRGEQGPKRRERKPQAARTQAEGDEKVEDTLSDTMVQQLLRLQRKMWDKTAYEPKYAEGSKAVQELLAQSQKLFAGEVKRVKKPGRFERRIGIAGMHGA